MKKGRSELRVGNRTLEVSNLDKVLYPAAGFTKAQVIDYYIRIARVLLPHLKDRPLTLKRYPNGVEAEFFYNIVAKELGRDTAQWERKCHVFIFDKAADWAEFQKQGKLDPWTGGLCTGGELFLLREADKKWKGELRERFRTEGRDLAAQLGTD